MKSFIDDVAEFSLSETSGLRSDLELWKQRYLSEKIAKKLEKKTIKSYQNGINVFIEFCELNQEYIEMKTISARFVNRFLMWYQSKLAAVAYEKNKISQICLLDIKTELDSKKIGKNDASFMIYEQFENTLSQRLVVLKDFLLYITENNIERHDYTKLFESFAKIKISEKMTDYLTAKELDKVISTMQEWPNIYKGTNAKPKSSLRVAYRDSFLILLYCLTGARSNEIVHVKLRDFLEEDGIYIVRIEHGKGGKKRALAIDKKYIKEHYDYLVSEIKDDNKYFSASYNVKNSLYSDKPMSPNTIRKFENFILKYLNIHKSGLHAVRRGFATKRIMIDGVDISICAKELGNTVAILEKHYLKHIPGVL